VVFLYMPPPSLRSHDCAAIPHSWIEWGLTNLVPGLASDFIPFIFHHLNMLWHLRDIQKWLDIKNFLWIQTKKMRVRECFLLTDVNITVYGWKHWYYVPTVTLKLDGDMTIYHTLL
jgi:hypothetical protein